jgi:methanogenic corrinoid protein MtbC1
MDVLLEISTCLQKGSFINLKEYIKKALERGITADDILNKGLLAGMDIVGRKFSNHEIRVPEVLIAARAMNAGIAIIKPMLTATHAKSRGKVVLGTIKGDLHDIGKNLVRIMFEAKGIDIIDLGTDVDPKIFVETAVKENVDFIACSALLTTSMMEIKVLRKRSAKENVKVMVGGAPITQNFCDIIGVDYYAPDAATASDMALMICSNNKRNLH